MSFKTKNDVSYFKFLEYKEAIIDSSDEEFILRETYRILKIKPRHLRGFAEAIGRDGKLKRCFILDLDFKRVGRFIDADTYRIDKEPLEMFKALLKPRRKFWRPWSRHKVEDISVREAEYVLGKWEEFLADIRFRYEYIYNPPVRIQAGETSQGSIERQEFAEHYGGYAEMTYLIANGMVKDFKSVWEWDLHFFLFWGEYLLRKRDVENIK